VYPGICVQFAELPPHPLQICLLLDGTPRFRV
jgi:hypothetical protein